MSKWEKNQSGYQGMWLVTMFDLPVDDAKARRAYTQFRKSLIKGGFSQLQFSIYARYYDSEETSHAGRGIVHAALPAEGEVRVLSITDKQFGKMEVFTGKKRQESEKPHEQLLLF